MVHPDSSQRSTRFAAVAGYPILHRLLGTPIHLRRPPASHSTRLESPTRHSKHLGYPSRSPRSHCLHPHAWGFPMHRQPGHQRVKDSTHQL